MAPAFCLAIPVIPIRPLPGASVLMDHLYGAFERLAPVIEGRRPRLAGERLPAFGKIRVATHTVR
jgi:hypothetical protein